MTWINDRSRKRNPHGGWKWKVDLQTAVLESALRHGASVEEGLSRLRQVCACCHRPFQADRILSNICDGCRVHLRCSSCTRDFDPSENTLGTMCSECWSIEQALVQTELDDLSPGLVRKRLYAVYRACFETQASCANAQPHR